MQNYKHLLVKLRIFSSDSSVVNTLWTAWASTISGWIEMQETNKGQISSEAGILQKIIRHRKFRSRMRQLTNLLSQQVPNPIMQVALVHAIKNNIVKIKKQ